MVRLSYGMVEWWFGMVLGCFELVASTGAVWWLVVLVWLYSFLPLFPFIAIVIVALVSESAAGAAAKYTSNTSHFVAQTPAGGGGSSGEPRPNMARGGCNCKDHREVLAVWIDRNWCK